MSSAGASVQGARAAASHFDGGWLALREPVDHRSRSHELAAMLGEFLAGRAASQAGGEAGRYPVFAPGLSSGRAHDNRGGTGTAPCVIDLGAGSGSNLRYLSRCLPHPLCWRLLDHDAGLLSALRGADPRDRVERQVCDLAALSPDMLEGADGVTASALLDLVSAQWIAHLVAASAAAGAAVLAALTIDGRVDFSTPDPLDAAICAWVARDHGRDKGLGVALGGAAPRVLAHALQARGYSVRMCASDWHLDRADTPLARALIEGWQAAARRQSPPDGKAITAWAVRRVASLENGTLRLTVGHLDVLGVPAAAGASSRS